MIFDPHTDVTTLKLLCLLSELDLELINLVCAQ